MNIIKNVNNGGDPNLQDCRLVYVVVVMFVCLVVIFSGQRYREVDGSDPEKAREIMIFIT